MQLVYLFHSGFAILGKDATLIIDFWRDTSGEDSSHGIVQDKLLKRPGSIYVLSSHFHPDHFTRKILEWRQQRPDIHYILSKDILKHKRAEENGDTTFLKKGECYEDKIVKIQACGSTDVGVSFLIQLEGMTLFHAGDLNNWHWSEESTPQEIRKADGDFLAEVKFIKQLAPAIDVVMFPIDRRIGKGYTRGVEQFIGHIKVNTLVPMHSFGDYDGSNSFKDKAEEAGCKFLTITDKEMIFEL